MRTKQQRPEPSMHNITPGFVIEDDDGNPAGRVTYVNRHGDVFITFTVDGKEYQRKYTAEEIEAVMNRTPLPVDSVGTDGEVLLHRWVTPANAALGEQHMQRVRNGVAEPLPESPRGSGGIEPWEMPPPGPGSIPAGIGTIVVRMLGLRRAAETYDAQAMEDHNGRALGDLARAIRRMGGDPGEGY